MKKKPVPKEDESDASDAVDEPEEVSDDDAASRRRSSRTTRNAGAKKAKLAEPSSSEGEEEGEEEEEEGEDEEEEGEDEEDSADSEEEYKTDQVKKTRRNGGVQGRPPSKTNGAVTSPDTSEFDVSLSEPVPKEFTSGSYVVLKTDLANGGDPPIWKIDGKALLQKYIPFEQDGKTLYKNTSTYSGWSTGNKDNYHSAPIAYKVQNRKETIVEFLRDAVKLDGTIPATPAVVAPAEEKKEAAATEQ